MGFPAQKRYRCRVCGRVLPAWLPVPQEPDGALLLGHLSQQHPAAIGAYLDRMHTTEDIGTVIVTAYVVVEEEDVR